MAQEKVLIVEDESFLKDLYVDTLSPQGYEVDTASDGEEALKKMREKKLDIILLDIILPKMSAFQILESVNKDPNYINKDTTVLMLTNLDSDFDIKRGLSLGATEFLLKSQITPGDLIKTVRMYLDKAKESTPQVVPTETPPPQTAA